MPVILKWGLIFFITTALATLVLQDNGKVSMVWDDWVLETSASFMVVVLVVAFVTLYQLTRLWERVIALPKRWREARIIKRHNKAEQTLSMGMIALEHGDWKVAEKQLIKSAKFSDAGLIHYLSAAKMAHNQQAPERRDEYLNFAKELYTDSHEIIGLVEARLLKESNPAKSLEILHKLFLANDLSKAVLSEYAKLLADTDNWQTLAEVLPQIKSSNVLDKKSLLEIESLLTCAQLINAENLDRLNEIWDSLEKNQKAIPNVLAEFIEQKIGWGQEEGLAELIIKTVQKNWDDRLVYQYGRLTFISPINYLKTAEKWLKQHEKNPILQLTLGRIATQAQLWAIAQAHLKISLKLQPEVETFHALAACYEKEGLESKAALTYKQAVLELDKKTK